MSSNSLEMNRRPALGRQWKAGQWAGRKENKMYKSQLEIKGEEILKHWDSDNRTAEEVAGFDIEPDKYYRISWPEHVMFPRLNGDCTIEGPLP